MFICRPVASSDSADGPDLGSIELLIFQQWLKTKNMAKCREAFETAVPLALNKFSIMLASMESVEDHAELEKRIFMKLLGHDEPT